MSLTPLHPRLKPVLEPSDGLAAVARELSVIAAQQLPPRRSRKRGATLRPGPGTPLWNAVVQSVKPYLLARDEKSRLARLLGVPPQRVHDYFGSGTAAPDAERTLLLLYWLAQRRAGILPG